MEMGPDSDGEDDMGMTSDEEDEGDEQAGQLQGRAAGLAGSGKQ